MNIAPRNCAARPVGGGVGMKFRKPLRPKTRNMSPRRSRAMRTIFVFMMVVLVGRKSGGSLAAAGVGAVPARDQNEGGENEDDGDHGVGGLFDGEGGNFSAAQPQLVVERHRAAG